MTSNSDFRYSKGMVFSTFAVLFAMIGLCICLSASSLMRLKQISQLNSLGELTRGEVYGKSIISGRSSEIFNIKYKFLENGKYYSGTSPMSREAYRAAHIGSPISIAYMHDNPQTSRVVQSVDQEQDVSEIEIVIVVAIGFLAIGYNLMIVARKTAAYRR